MITTLHTLSLVSITHAAPPSRLVSLPPPFPSPPCPTRSSLRRRQKGCRIRARHNHVAHVHGDLGGAAPAATLGSRRRRRRGGGGCGGSGHVERPPGHRVLLVPVVQDVGEPPGLRYAHVNRVDADAATVEAVEAVATSNARQAAAFSSFPSLKTWGSHRALRYAHVNGAGDATAMHSPGKLTVVEEKAALSHLREVEARRSDATDAECRPRGGGGGRGGRPRLATVEATHPAVPQAQGGDVVREHVAAATARAEAVAGLRGALDRT